MLITKKDDGIVTGAYTGRDDTIEATYLTFYAWHRHMDSSRRPFLSPRTNLSKLMGLGVYLGSR